MRYKKSEDWIPSDNLVLEDNALTTVKSNYNTLVVAGPGAGKTELLAQRACYLLETNNCLFPQKILAISFKRDAAFNLKARVEKRCGESLTKRFESLTFDAFAKIILDRFFRGLPNEFKISGEYDILVLESNILDLYKAFDIDFFNSYSKDAILNFHNGKLPLRTVGNKNPLRWKVWQKLLLSDPSQISFKMIMRLAQLVIETNPQIKKYLQITYSHLFLDEFQDTTGLQYDFLNSCFHGSNAVLTAVGDDKQRIMLWAGAQPDVFLAYKKDYIAIDLALKMNFRSAPKLVDLQNHLISKLLNKSDLVIASEKWDKDAGEALVWFYENPENETINIFESVKKWMVEENLNSRDFCILVKQQLSTYVGSLIEYFCDNGIKARDENQLQDLLTGDVILFVINALLLISKKKSLDEKTYVLNFLTNICHVYDDRQLLAIENELNSFILKLRNIVKSHKEQIKVRVIIDEIINFASIDRIKSNYPNYRNPKYLNDLLKQLSDELDKGLNSGHDLNESIDILLGKDSIPVMTIHKSKGLEYHTVIFIGLEDGAFWSFESQPDEDKCAFFVALSRAKERVVFTFSKNRYNKWGTLKQQSFEKIKVLFDELGNSGIVKFEDKDKNE